METRHARSEAMHTIGRFGVVGIFAMALSLAGVLGGHQLLGELLGVPEEEVALAHDGDAECPPTLHANDACDSDSEAASPDRDREDRDGCALRVEGGR